VPFLPACPTPIPALLNQEPCRAAVEALHVHPPARALVHEANSAAMVVTARCRGLLGSPARSRRGDRIAPWSQEPAPSAASLCATPRPSLGRAGDHMSSLREVWASSTVSPRLESEISATISQHCGKPVGLLTACACSAACGPKTIVHGARVLPSGRWGGGHTPSTPLLAASPSQIVEDRILLGVGAVAFEEGLVRLDLDAERRPGSPDLVS